MKKQQNSAFECVDGSFIHYANLETLTLYKYEDIEFVFVNGKRILNNKLNEKLMKIIFPYYVAIGKKVTFKISEVIEEDLKPFYAD